jgi:hypothetical protein
LIQQFWFATNVTTLEIVQNGENADEQCDAPKSRIGRVLMVSLLAATSVIADVRP